MVDKIIRLILLASPLIYSSRMAPGKFEIILFYGCTFLLFLASLLDTPKREGKFLAKGIAVFLSFCFINSAIHLFPSYSIATLLNLSLFCFMFYTMHRFMCVPEKYYRYIRVAFIVNVIVFLAQKYWFNFLPFSAYTLGGTFGSIQRFSLYVAVITPILFSSMWWLLAPIGLMSWSVNPGLTFFMMLLRKATLAIGLRNFKIFLVVVLAFISIYLMRKHIETSLLVRIKFFVGPTLKSISDNLLIGKGLGSYYANIGNDPYNSLMAFIYDVGIFGLGLVVYGFYKIRKYFDRSKESFALIGLILISMVDYPLEISRLWPIIAFILASFFIKKEEVC